VFSIDEEKCASTNWLAIMAGLFFPFFVIALVIGGVWWIKRRTNRKKELKKMKEMLKCGGRTTMNPVYREREQVLKSDFF